MKDTKQYILDTALKLFLQKTFKEVTMKEIVDATELSKGAFYHYFASKEQLFKEVIEKYLLSHIDIDYKKLDNSSLKAFYRDCLNHRNEAKHDSNNPLFNPKELNINRFSLIFESIKLFPEVREEFQKMDRIETSAWIEVIAKAKLTNEIHSEMSNENIASIFMYTADAINLHSIMGTESKDRQKMAKQIIELWDSFYNQLTHH